VYNQKSPGEKRLPKPFELSAQDLNANLELMVDSVFGDLESQFLVLPKGSNFIEYADFQTAYEVLKRTTDGFRRVEPETLWASIKEDGLSFVVIRTILGLSPPEWADLARSDFDVDVPQNAARDLDTRCRGQRNYFARLNGDRNSLTWKRVDALISAAVKYVTQGAPAGAANVVHRLAKVDTTEGIASLTYVAGNHIPYAVLLYERYLGRPFASHRDSVSELVGDVMEQAIEERLSRARVTFRKTKRAERVPGLEQAPDFFVPDEFNPAVLIEAKITGDDGTARDKATRIVNLAKMRDERIQQGRAGFQVVACIDGRGFGVRREDMRRMLLKTEGKVFTLASLDHLIQNTRIREFLPAR
jgi:hypothetical protein